jgi:predicted metal-binding membrane protein
MKFRQAIAPARWQGWSVLLPLASLACPAWMVLAMSGAGLILPVFCSSQLLWSVPSPQSIGYFFSYVSFIDLTLSWLLMVVGMMLPTLFDLLGYVRLRGFRDLQSWLIALVIIGYGSVWALTGLAFLGFALILRLVSPNDSANFVFALIVAFVWHISPWRQSALNRGHQRPELAAFAPKAYGNALAVGASRGLWCVASCWALMLVCLLAPAYHFSTMVVLAVYIWAEQLEPPRRPVWQLYLPMRAWRLFSFWLSTVGRR